VEDLDAIAVTYGPGLAIALEVGLNKAKQLATEHSKPLVAINHMEGHLLSAFAERNYESQSINVKAEANNLSELKFPVLGFLVSGGHTELVLVKDWFTYKKIGETLDDACGECFDKSGRLLGLGYPGGPVISKFAKEHRDNLKIDIRKRNTGAFVVAKNIKSNNEYELPISMINSGDLNFSYSGLKSAFGRLVENKKVNNNLTAEVIKDLCVVFEAAALFQLTIKLESAIRQYSPNEVWLGGGVIASSYFKKLVRNSCKAYSINVRYPYSKKLTGDNAAMIGVAANLRISKFGLNHSPTHGIYTKQFEKIDRDPNLDL
jgi:N6-L-threonylcarbamoyladenine synthase